MAMILSETSAVQLGAGWVHHQISRATGPAAVQEAWP